MPLRGCLDCVHDGDHGGRAENLAGMDHLLCFVKGYPSHGLGFVGVWGADEVGAACEIEVLGRVGGADGWLEGEQVAEVAGPPAGFFLNFACRGGGAVFAGVGVAAGDFPVPLVDNEPVPPDKKDVVAGLVEDGGHRASRHAEDVLVESLAAGEFDAGDGQANVRVGVHFAFAVDGPAGPFGGDVVGHIGDATTGPRCGEPGRSRCGRSR